MPKQQKEVQQQQQLYLTSAPEQNHNHHYHKPQIFTFITNQHLSNYICMPLCGVFWVGGFIFSNENKVSPIQANYTRYFIQIISTLVILAVRRQSVSFKNNKDFKLLLIRSAISGLNGVAASLFQLYLPLTIYYTLNSSTTLFAFLLNHFLFGLHMTSNQIKSVIAAIFGIILVINGRFIYTLINSSYQFQSTFIYETYDIWAITGIGCLVVIWSCVWAYGIVITGKHHSSLNQFIFINSLIGFFMFSIAEMMISPATEVSSPILFIQKPQLIFKIMLYTGIPLAAANYIFNAGVFISTNSGISTMLTNFNILYVYFISTIRYDESINLICLIGSFILVGSIYVVLFKK